METKNNKDKVDKLQVRLLYDEGDYVEPQGLSGGLILW